MSLDVDMCSVKKPPLEMMQMADAGGSRSWERPWSSRFSEPQTTPALYPHQAKIFGGTNGLNFL